MTETSWTWQKGHFYSFRATRDIAMPHGAPFPTLREDEIFEFDGTTLKMDDGEQVKVPQLQGCLMRQWMVPADDTESEYVPQPAGVEVHAARQMGNDPSRGASQMVTSHDDMQQVGSVEAQRKARRGEAAQPAVTQAPAQAKTPPKAMSKLARQLIRDFDLIAAEYGVSKAESKPQPKPRPKPKAAPEPASEPKTLRERMVVSTREEQVVGPARPKQPPLDGGPIRGTEVVTDSGRNFAGADEPAGELDVGSAKPLMVTATRTEKGQAKAGKTEMPVEVEDQDGVPIASLGKPRKRQDVTDTAKVSEEVGKLSKPMGKKAKFEVVEESAEDAGEVVSSVEEAKEKAEERAAAPPMGSTLSPEIQQKIAGIKMFVPDFAWNLDRPWKARVADAVDNYAEKPDWIRGILGIETPDVQRHIKTKLKKAGVEI